MLEVRDFLEAIFQESEGFLCAAYGKDRDPTTNKYKHWKELQFELNGKEPRYEQFLKTTDVAASKGWDCFFTPAIFNKPRRKPENFLHSNVLWADFDNASDLPEFEVSPSLIVRSSPGKHHVYWNLHDAVDKETLESLNRQLAYAYGADKSGWDCNQLLRVPNTLNYKPEYGTPQPVVLQSLVMVSYPVDKFQRFLTGSLIKKIAKLEWLINWTLSPVAQ